MISSAAFESIDESAGTDSTMAWAAEEENARRERIYDVTVMDIYDISMKKREFDYSSFFLLTTGFSPFSGGNPS